MDYRKIIAPRMRKVTLLEARYNVSGDITVAPDGNFCGPLSDDFPLKIAFSPVLPVYYSGAVAWPHAIIDATDLRLVRALDLFPCEQVTVYACRYDEKTECVTLTTPAEATDALLQFFVANTQDLRRSIDYAAKHNWKSLGTFTTENSGSSLYAASLTPELRALFDELEEEHQLDLTLNALCAADAEEYAEQYRHELMTLALYARDQLGWTAYLEDNDLTVYYLSGDGSQIICESFGLNAYDVNCLEDLICIAEEADCGSVVL